MLKTIKKFLVHFYSSKSGRACAWLILSSALDAALKPSNSYMDGFCWVGCAAKIMYLTSWLVWAFFFTRSFWPEYDDSTNSADAESDSDWTRLVKGF